MPKISVFPPGYYSKKLKKLVPAVKPVGEMDFQSYLDNIKNGYYQDEVLHYRAGRIEKLKLPGVTPSGVFSYRSRKNLSNHSGLMVIDIDKDDQLPTYDYKKVRLQLMSDEYIHAFHLSCSGDGGLAAYVKIDPAKHYEAFEALEKYFADKYNIIIDQSGKDTSRFRFVSYDPDLYFNVNSKKWTKYIPKKKAEPRKHNYIFTDDDLEHVFAQISRRGIDLTYDYHDWFRVACALSDKYGASGLDKFHMVSSQSPKYDSKACDQLYNIILKRNNSGIKIGTFLWMAQQHGIDIVNPETKKIIEIAQARRKMIGKSGGYDTADQAKKESKKYLKEIEKLEGGNVDEIVEKVMNAPVPEKTDNPDDILAQLKAYLTLKDLKRNSVTGQYEYNGEPMTDRLFNSIYIETLENVSTKVNQTLLMSLIDSENTPEYDPFKNFFNKHKNVESTGHIDELLACFDIQHSETTKKFIRKWLLSIVASAHGTYSLMILVLAGNQRAGKTEFFRKLFPDDLMSYYGESKLDDGKDSEILMTKKLLIVDDEFSGKSKRDYKRLKDLSSKQWFNVRKPYGKHTEDMKRYAVLAGTSNEDEVINDPTGNRRIIPINVNSIDHDRMDKIDRINLWMELYDEWQKIGDGWMLTTEDIKQLDVSSEFNKQPSIEEELVLKHFEPGEDGDVYTELFSNTDIKLHIENANPTVRISTWKLGATLKTLGFSQKVIRVGKKTKRVYMVKKIFDHQDRSPIEGFNNDDIPF